MRTRFLRFSPGVRKCWPLLAVTLLSAPLLQAQTTDTPAALPLLPYLPAGAFEAEAGLGYEYSSALGHAGRLSLNGGWQALDWLKLDLGLRFALREAAPWAAGSPPGAAFAAETQYLQLVVHPLPWLVPAQGGLILRHNGYPGTAAGWFSIVPWNQLRLGPIRALIGLDMQTWVDPDAPAPDAARAPWGFQLLAALGLRLDLAGPDTWVDLSVDTGGPWEPASFQALGLVLESRLPVAEGWWLRPRAELRSAGATTMTNTFGRFRAEVAVEGVFP